MKNKNSIITASAITSYGLLKVSQSKIDPYTRFSIGVISGSLMAFSQNPILRFAGIGLIIGSALQIIDVRKGGKLAFNNSNKNIFVLHESGDINEIAPYEIPNFNIDGFTFKGLNGVFKLSDGIYAGINNDNTISYSLGIGVIVNSFRNAGLKNKSWVNAQDDKRWCELFNMSF